jgi:hypothetical protein
MFDSAGQETIWNLHEKDFGKCASRRERILFLLQYAVLAPSSHNSQPWKFRLIDDETVEIFTDNDRWLKIADADQREMFISVGCALENLLIAAEHFGLTTEVEYEPDKTHETLAVRITLDTPNESNQLDYSGLFEYIPRRSTYHQAFINAPVSPEILSEINACCDIQGVNLFLTESTDIRAKVHDLIVHSDAMQFADPQFRQELAYWIGQGAFGTSWLLSQIESLAVAYLNFGKTVAESDAKVLKSAPVMGLITTIFNDRTSQIKAGQVFERIYLTAHKFGLRVRPMSQICEIPAHKEELRKLVGLPHNFPQQPFLIGYAEPSDFHTPRRPVEEVLID